MPTKPPSMGKRKQAKPWNWKPDAERASTTARGYGWDWQKLRNQYIAQNPICCDPLKLHPNRVIPATDVDHVIPLAQGGARLEWSNLRSLCRECHRQVTARATKSAP